MTLGRLSLSRLLPRLPAESQPTPARSPAHSSVPLRYLDQLPLSFARVESVGAGVGRRPEYCRAREVVT